MFFMDKIRGIKIFFLAIGLLFAKIAPAQELPVLAADGAVKTGRLPNGTEYYIVANPAFKGLADFALVQKTGKANISDTLADRTVEVARCALSELPRSGGKSVQEFFASHGVTPGKEGFVKVSDDATEFRFNDVLVSKPEVVDSVLLVLLDIVDRVNTADDEFIHKWYVPSDQAIIISGDIAPDSVIDKLKMISYMTPSVPSSPRHEYSWEEWDTASYVHEPASEKGLATMTATWRSARTPWNYMNTVQPVIYEIFLEELGMIAEEHLGNALRSMNIPFADISYDYVTSLHSSGDESFSISVSADEKDFPDVVRILSEVMGGIDSGHTDIRDFTRIKRVCTDLIAERAMEPFTENSAYIDRCVAAFLYNGSLAGLNAKVDFLIGRVLDDSTELRLFNNIASALLDCERNLTISYASAMAPDDVRNTFTSSWYVEAPGAAPARQYSIEDIPVYVYEGPKMKIVEKVDHISKGKEWTFSNGIKVVYRKMPTGGRLYYDMALNGGFGMIEDLEKGEGGYVSDYFMLSRIHDVPADEFINILAAEGMSMDVHTGLNNMMISGSVEDNKVDLLMNALLAVMNGRSQDADAVRYYESGEYLRHRSRLGTSAEMVAKINEIMCPDYRQVSYKMLDRLSPELAGKADGLFTDLLSRANDGVLVLVGDMNESVLKKKLLAYMSGFRTSERAARRPLVRYQPSSGWSTYTVYGERNSIDIALSCPLALTTDNQVAVEVAAMMLKKRLAEAVADSQMYLDLSHESRIYPNERVNLHISLNEISAEGFSSDVEYTENMDALSIVRSVLSEISESEISDEEVNLYKEQLKNRTSHEIREPFYWLNVISRRHLAGKDFTSNYESRINALDASKVRDMLGAIAKGTRVEYIVSRR